MLAGRDVKARGPGVVDHHPVGAAIDPALVRVAGDVEAAGADVAAAVAGVPDRHREAGDVDFVAAHDVLEDRTVGDVCGRDARHRPHEIAAEAFAQLDLGEIGREAERHILALTTEEVDQQAAALDGARHLIEHEAGRAVLVHRHARDEADVLLPGEPAHLFHLAEPARLVEPLAQIVVGEPRRDVRAGRADVRGRSDRTAHGVGLARHEFLRDLVDKLTWAAVPRHPLIFAPRSVVPREGTQRRTKSRLLAPSPKYLYC